MKRILVIALLTTIFSCQKTEEKQIEINKEAIEKNINTVLDSWHIAAAEANYENYFNAMDSVSVFIGTDASENWTKEQFENFSKPYFDKGKAWSFTALERNVYTNKTGDIAWFDELLQTWMGTCRGSGVLEKNNDTWKIKHYVLSVAIPNEDVKEVIIAKRKNDSIFQMKFRR